MGIVQKDALRTTVVSYFGILLGYLNKGFFFLLFLSTEQIGFVNLLVSSSLLVGNLSALGNGYIIWRFFPYLQNNDRGHYGLLRYNLALGFIGLTLFSLILIIFKEPVSAFFLHQMKGPSDQSLFRDYYYWIIPLGAAFLLYFTLDYYLRSLMKNLVTVVSFEIILRLVTLAVLLLFGFKAITFNQFIVAFCLCHFVPALILLVYLWQIKQLHLRVSPAAIPARFRKIMFRFGLYSYSNSISITIFTTIDVILVASITGMKAAGVYSTIVFFVSALQVPSRAMIRISSVLVSKNWKNKDMEAMNKLYKAFSSVNLLLALYLSALVLASRNEIFGLLPTAFSSGIAAFIFVIIGRVFDNFMGLNAVVLQTSKKYRLDTYITAFGTLMLFFGNIFCIRLWGITGAGIAFMIVMIVVNSVRSFLVYKFYAIHPFERKQLYVLLLFAPLIICFEFIEWKMDSALLLIALKSVLISIVIWTGVIVFKLDDNVLEFFRNRLGARKLKK